MIQVAVFGYGTVGSGVVEVIEKNKNEIGKKAGDEIRIKYILDLKEFPDDPYKDKIVKDVELILNDPEVDIICETMGGLEPAYTFSKRALMSGKSVCTSNKELVAAHGPKLLKIAKDNKCNYLFEASVGGGIPIIRPLNYSLTAERIQAVTGILNGTTNYILTKMDKDGAGFEEVLREAQEKGYAERNPAADVEGYDACRKIAILSSLMIGKNVKYEEIYTEGITKITAEDFKYAALLGKSIKLLAQSRETDKGYVAMVAPFMIDKEHPLYSVTGVYNAIFIQSNMLGNSMYYGRGAGKLPTASAVVSDIVDCARHIGKTITCIWEQEDVKLADVKESSRRFFVRVGEGSEETVKELFGNREFLRVIEGEFGFVTDEMTEKEFERKAEALSDLITRIRMEA
ncbi:MAG: homoserine dehydrogenase [Lachnospiraceae bacterium]|nr:homoserine dehydrogenase [Lachnospiraceae bacterium]